MPIIPYVNQLEPSEDAVIWRFMDLFKFRDLMASEELYFRRADLFTDESEGLPPEQYAMRVLGLDPHDVRDRVNWSAHERLMQKSSIPTQSTSKNSKDFLKSFRNSPRHESDFYTVNAGRHAD